MSMAKGEFVIGTLVGYSETPWSSDSSRFNRRVRVCTGAYIDGFGQEHPNNVDIDVQFEAAQKIKQQCDNYQGKEVMVPFVPMARKGGRDGAWLARFMPKDSDILPLSSKTKAG